MGNYKDSDFTQAIRTEAYRNVFKKRVFLVQDGNLVFRLRVWKLELLFSSSTVCLQPTFFFLRTPYQKFDKISNDLVHSEKIG